jgi:predicted RNA methylase
MVDIIDFNSRTKTKKDRIYNQCPPLKSHEIPQIYEIKLIESHKEKIEEYDVVFWHRLLKTIYREPLEIECELSVRNQSNKSLETATFRRLEEQSKWNVLNATQETILKMQSGEITPIPVNWKYFLRLPSGGIIEIGTKDHHNVLYFSHIVNGRVQVEDHEQADKFISLLLDEAKKEEELNKLFNPLKEFKNQEGVKIITHSIFHSEQRYSRNGRRKKDIKPNYFNKRVERVAKTTPITHVFSKFHIVILNYFCSA